MKEYRLSNNVQIFKGQAFSDQNGKKYPGNWLELATPTDLAAAGITATDVPDPPAPPVVIAGPDLLGRFTDPEYLALHAAATTNAKIARWLDLVLATNAYSLDNVGLPSLIAALVSAGVINSGRANVIFS
jgi:hypothetical protein